MYPAPKAAAAATRCGSITASSSIDEVKSIAVSPTIPMAASRPSFVRGSRTRPHIWSTATAMVQPRMRPKVLPNTRPMSHSTSDTNVASKTVASSISASTAAKHAGTARRHSRNTPPRACGDVVHKHNSATSTVNTFDRLRGEIMENESGRLGSRSHYSPQRFGCQH